MMQSRRSVSICTIAVLLILSFYLLKPPVEGISRALGFTSTPTAEPATDTPTPEQATETSTPEQPTETPTGTPLPAPTVENTETPSPTPTATATETPAHMPSPTGTPPPPATATPESAPPDKEPTTTPSVTMTPFPLMPLSGEQASKGSDPVWLLSGLGILLLGCLLQRCFSLARR